MIYSLQITHKQIPGRLKLKEFTATPGGKTGERMATAGSPTNISFEAWPKTSGRF